MSSSTTERIGTSYKSPNRMELYEASKAAFDNFKPESFERTFGETIASDEMLDRERKNGANLSASETRASINYYMSMLANALIVKAIGPVPGQSDDAPPIPFADLAREQKELDKIFGFVTDGFNAKDGISYEMQKLSDVMSAAIEKNLAAQESRRTDRSPSD